MSMFCYQCQEAAKGIGCTGAVGVCGIKDDVIHLQDLTVYILKGISLYSVKARENGIEDEEINNFFFTSLFKTITNANFSKEVFVKEIKRALVLRGKIKNTLIEKGITISDINHDTVSWTGSTLEEFEAKAQQVSGKIDAPNEDIRSLRALILYGLKGLTAYQEHAFNLGFEDATLHAFVQKAVAALVNDNLTVEENIALVMETGKFGVDVMALLDKANTTTYGNPEITSVNIGVRNNPGILISGHDLKDMEDLLKQTEGTGVDVYTHSEMLPANYYPAFKKYDHFVGNYGNAWWKQKEEFESFNGPILFTTNCLVPPKKDAGYYDRVYTTGAAGFDGFPHIADREKGGQKDFSQIIELAKKCAAPIEIEKGEIVGGFAHNQVMQLADKVVDAVKSGAIKKFFVMAGCYGRMKNRDYYTEFADRLPKDTVILTAGCAKYRYNKLELGDIGGIPRVLDAGQCNDSYSLAVIALKLKEVFELNDINELPIAYNIAWYEQKAVIVLLALLYLGVKNIHLGPTLPAFLSPNVAKVLVETFGIGGITNVDDDIKMFMN
ncbi:MAG: hydroxylamine reductase [Marinilabiliales bacterium]|nr:MAG: hydroxylamine reductase [Marinilabiliales bacterium]